MVIFHFSPPVTHGDRQMFWKWRFYSGFQGCLSRGVCYQHTPPPWNSGLSPSGLPHPRLRPNTTHATATIPPSPQAKTLSFVCYPICPDNCLDFALRFARVYPALGPFFTGSQSTFWEIPLPVRESARARGEGSQCPEEASPPPPPPIQKAHPQPPRSGDQERSKEGLGPDTGSGIRAPGHSPRRAQPAGNQ